MSDFLQEVLPCITEDNVKAASYILNSILTKLKLNWKKLDHKKRIELLITSIMQNDYKLQTDVIAKINEDFGVYESTWGKLLKTIVSYPQRAESIFELCKEKGYLEIKERNVNCKIKIKKIEKLSNDLKWGFHTAKRKNPKSLPVAYFYGAEIFHDESVPKGTVYIRLEKLSEDESLFAIFSLPEVGNE